MTELNSAFLPTLFRDKPDDLYVSVWRPGLGCTVNKNPAFLFGTSGDPVYFHVGAHRALPVGRPDASEIDGVGAIWVDIDCAGPAHTKRGLPQNSAVALSAISGAFPLKPSIEVDSGYGLHLYWLLNEWVEFNSNNERNGFSDDIVYRFQRALSVGAKFTIDSTHDVSRVLRLPGSKNTKIPGVVRTCDVHRLDADARFSLVEFVEALDLIGASHAKPVHTPPALENKYGLTINSEAPRGKLLSLIETSPVFYASWLNQRDDLADNSASTYDYSLACFAIRANWADDEIAAMLVEHRRKHGYSLKLDRKDDYYARTIANAHAAVAADAAGEAPPRPPPPEPPASDESARVPDDEAPGVFAALAAAIAMPLVAIEKHGIDDPVYILRFSDGCDVDLGGVDALLSQTKFRAKIVERRDAVPLDMKGAQWKAFVRKMLSVLDVRKYDDTSAFARLAAWIAEYMPIATAKNAAVAKSGPFQDAKSIHIHASHFENWITINQKGKVSAHRLRAWLSSAGFRREEVKVPVDDKGKRVKRWYYTAPISMLEAARGEEFDLSRQPVEPLAGELPPF